MKHITASEILRRSEEAQWRELNDPEDSAYKARKFLEDAFLEPIVNRTLRIIMDDFKKTEDTIAEERDGFTVYASGATRNNDVEHLRYDLIPECALRELAEVYAEGAKRHGDNNWKKGMSDGVLMNHAVEHLMKYREGDRSENHLGKAMFGLAGMIWNREVGSEETGKVAFKFDESGAAIDMVPNE